MQGRFRVEPPRVRRREPGWKRAWRRYRLPVGLGAAALGWYAADSLSHRREGAFGYEIEPDLAVSSPDFLRAAEALTGAPISEGNAAELLINGDRIFPAFLETIESAQSTLNVQTYVYWRGEIARDVAKAIGDRAREGVRCNVILDALGAAKMERSLVHEMESRGRPGDPLPTSEAVRGPADRQPHPSPAADRRRPRGDDRRGRDRVRVDR